MKRVYVTIAAILAVAALAGCQSTRIDTCRTVKKQSASCHVEKPGERDARKGPSRQRTSVSGDQGHNVPSSPSTPSGVDPSPPSVNPPSNPPSNPGNPDPGVPSPGTKDKHDNNGWGNGDQNAPGNSQDHNNAENGGGKKGGKDK